MTEAAATDYRIRIAVNSGRDNQQNNRHRSQQNSSTEESESAESGASVTIVEIDNARAHYLDNDTTSTNANHRIKNTLNDYTSSASPSTPPTSKSHNPIKKQYNEKPIDVPAEFERKAYEHERNELSPFVRNLQPNSQVINFTVLYQTFELYCFR